MPLMGRSLFARSSQVIAMTEDHVPPTPANLPRPVRLIGNANNSAVPDTPPLLPGIHDFEIEAYNPLEMYRAEPDIEEYNTIKMNTTGPVINGHVLPGSQDVSQSADTAG